MNLIKDDILLYSLSPDIKVIPLDKLQGAVTWMKKLYCEDRWASRGLPYMCVSYGGKVSCSVCQMLDEGLGEVLE